jgi:hypothetical protein
MSGSPASALTDIQKRVLNEINAAMSDASMPTGFASSSFILETIRRLTRERDEARADAQRLREALGDAIRIAGVAANEWDRAPEGMRAGKLLLALSGKVPGYRADIDEVHAALAAQTPVTSPVTAD